MDAANIVELVKALVWPIVVVGAMLLFYKPLQNLIRTIGERLTRLSLFQVEFELAALKQAKAGLEATVEALRQVTIGESGAGAIAAGVSRSGSADYVVISLGADGEQKWLTSRLFLVAAIFERSRIVRCIVFTGANSAFVGAATPRDVRIELGSKFPVYEKSLLSAYGAAANMDLAEFQDGNWSPALADAITNGFLRTGGGLVRPEYAASTDPGWIFLPRNNAPSTWEYAAWVTSGSLAEMLQGRFAAAGVPASPGNITEEVQKAIIRQQGPFVGLVNATGQFLVLCDRMAMAEKIARNAAAQ